jgi:hypothetical protein
MQSAAVEQLLLHRALAASQVSDAGQVVVLEALQLPAPEQCPSGVNVFDPAGQDAEPQATPIAYLAHPPAPSQ